MGEHRHDAAGARLGDEFLDEVIWPSCDILDPDFTTIGIGCVYVGEAGPYWVQCFGDGVAASFARPAIRSLTVKCDVRAEWLKSENFEFRQTGYTTNVGADYAFQPEVRFINQRRWLRQFRVRAGSRLSAGAPKSVRLQC